MLCYIFNCCHYLTTFLLCNRLHIYNSTATFELQEELFRGKKGVNPILYPLVYSLVFIFKR
ncbi:hypothetical protein CMALT430_60026 [Carnobacterium maltaromaticum]|nr:hypothetical protein CMALT430_60026 [Carnobacterium maltaromaticum]